ncbi:MAG: hypothetical protein L6R19_20145 [Alphaproteobacteria bacterium]|nr:hypothetical protein [Alphaproteobacteria bacterium]
MLGFGSARRKVKRQYEVLYQREGRWEIDGLFDADDAAVARAEGLVASDKFDAVKVVGQRNGINGGIVEEEPLFLKERQARAKPLQITGDTTPVEPCTGPKQLFALDSRLAIGRLLRPFLDKLQITPTELLHTARLIQRLDNTGNLAMAAIHRVASLQAKAMNVPARQRAAEIERFVSDARTLARDYDAERRNLPPFDREDLSRTRRRLAGAAAEGRGDHIFLCHLSAILVDLPSMQAKLELVIDLMGRESAAEAIDLLEGVVADILADGEALRDALGAQPTLQRHIDALIDAITGAQPETPWPAGSIMPALSRLVASGAAPQCRRVLTERVQAVLASPVPLDPSQPEADPALLQVVVDRLTKAAGKLLGGEATAAAVALRRRRQQAAQRQRLGLE